MENLMLNKKMDTKRKILWLILSAVSIGFMWRVRGSHGFGSMWGMFCVGVMLLLIIFSAFGDKIKCRYEYLPIGVFLLGITNGGWGTLNSQMGGYLTSTAAFTGQEFASEIPISEYSGLIIMLLLGFGWMPLFAVFIGSLFSNKDYKLKDYVIFIAVYYVVMYLIQYTVAHPLLELINYDAVEGFKAGLADREIEMSPFMAYIKNMGSAAWAKKVPYGRNYFTSIEVIASAISALITSLAVRFILKDKVAARISTAINAVCAIAITVADVFLVVDSDRGFFKNVESKPFIDNNAWSLWEYFTGFLLGFGIMAVLLIAANKSKVEKKSYLEKAFIKNEKLNLVYNSLFTLLFTFVVTLARPFGIRFASIFTEDDDLPGAVITVVVSVILFFFCLKLAKKNLITQGLATPVDKSLQLFSVLAMNKYFLLCFIILFFVGSVEHGYIFAIPYREIIETGNIGTHLSNGVGVMQIICILSLVIFSLVYQKLFVSAKKNK